LIDPSPREIKLFARSEEVKRDQSQARNPEGLLYISSTAFGYEIRFGIFSGVSCSGERMAGNGEDLCVRRDPPGFAPLRCGCDLPGGSQCPVHCGARTELEPVYALG